MREIQLNSDDVALIGVLRARGAVDRGELSRATGRSISTIGRSVERLRGAGFVRESAVPPASRGRPPRLVELRPEAGYVVAVDAGASVLRAACADLEGTIRARASAVVRNPGNVERLIDDLAGLVDDVAPRGSRRPLALAAGVSGIVDHVAGRVLVSPDLPALAGLGLAAALEDRLGVTVAVDNDDLLAAVGEATDGAARGCSNIAFLSIGYGLGAGLIVDGRPLRGASSSAGAISFLDRGRLSEVASGRSLPQRFREAAARVANEAITSPKRDAVEDARTVFELSARGDAVAALVVREAADVNADVALDVAALLDPEVLVLGGGVALAGSVVLETVGERLRSTLPYPPRLVPSALGDSAVLHGAVAFALALARDVLSGTSADRSPPGQQSRRPLQLDIAEAPASSVRGGAT
jgi:predicted NBD/HSP70 family sugar kinase